ncbi:unnamed protein product, partial [Nesidiocoris tenuis]
LGCQCRLSPGGLSPTSLSLRERERCETSKAIRTRLLVCSRTSDEPLTERVCVGSARYSSANESETVNGPPQWIDTALGKRGPKRAAIAALASNRQFRNAGRGRSRSR